jgi:hypothetical protein
MKFVLLIVLIGCIIAVAIVVARSPFAIRRLFPA